MIPRPEALADLAIKSTALLAIGVLAVASLSRRRPALAAACGHAALVGLWLLPLALFFFPQLTWHILPAEPIEQPIASAIVDSSPEPPALPDFAPSSAALPLPDPLPSAAPEPPPPPPIAEPEPPPAPEPWDPYAVALAAYAAISCLFLARLALSLFAVRRLVRLATHVEDSPWIDVLHELNANRNPVQLLWSSRVGVPVVIGWLRPAILLPTHLQASDPSTARAVLLHELAHIRRRDYPWNVFLRLTLSLYWPHPLAWLLSRTLSNSRENACDAYCVHALGGPAPYADALLTVVTMRLQSSIPTPSLGLAMARPSRLRSRLARIATTPGTPTVTPSLPSRLLLLALILPLSALLGPLHLAPAEAEPIRQTIATPKPVDPTNPAGRTLTIRVVSAETGKPLSKPEARAWIGVDETRLTGDQDGILRILHSAGTGDRTLTIDLAAPGYALQRHAYGRSPTVPIPDEVTIKLQPGETLGGIAQDELGRPVAGAEILLWSQNYTRKDPSELLFDLRAISGPDGRWQTTSAPQTNGEIFGYKVRHPDYISDLRTVDTGDALPTIVDLRAGKAVIVLKKGVPIEGRVTDAEDRPIEGATVLATKAPDMVFEDFRASHVKTDATGRFRHGQVKPGDWYVLVQSKNHAPARAAVTIGTTIPRLSFTLRQGRTYRGRVIDPLGKPITGALVGVDSWDGFRGLSLRTWSDAEGRFHFDQLPRGDVRGRVEAIGYIGSVFKVEDPAEENVFRLQRVLTISGRVRDAETGKAIPRGRVEFGKPDPRTGEVESWLDVSSSPNPLYQGFLNVGLTAEVEACRLRIIVDGYAPVVSRVFKVDEIVVNDYDVSLPRLRPGDAPTAVVTGADGKPLVGARVHTLQPVIMNTVDAGSLILQSTTAPRELRTDKEGRFVLPFASGLLLILGDREFAILSPKEVAAQANKIQSKPYARVEGRLLRAGRPLPNRLVRLQGTLRREEVQPGWVVSLDSEAMTDAEGRFVFDKVLPLPSLRVKMADGTENGVERRSAGKPIHPRPGETLRVQVGGGGRPVVGLAALPENMPQPVSFSKSGNVCLTNGRDRIPYPLSILRGTTKLNHAGLAEWKRAWDASPEGRATDDGWREFRQSLELDGSFRLDDVPPGRYQLWLSYGETDRTKATQPPLTLVREVTVPEGPSDTPLDLGTLPFEETPVAQIGRPAPVVRATGLDGKPVSTESYKGKYVVVSFETISTPARLEIPDLNALHAPRRDDPRVAFLSVILAPDDDATRRYARDKGQPWPQAIHPPNPAWMSSPFFTRDHYYLIAPDGTLAYRAAHPSELEKFLPAAEPAK